MRKTSVVVLVLAGALAGGGCATGRYAHEDRGRASWRDSLATMTKQDIIELSKAGISDSVILNLMDYNGSLFRINTRDVIDLKNAGVSDRVITAMMTPNEPAQGGDTSGRYYEYPPYYWYADYPFWYPWYPWYPSFYFGFSGGFYRPFHGFRTFGSHYGIVGHGGFYGGRGVGGHHGGGRHR